MIATPSPAFRPLRAPGYFILTLAALMPVADYVTTVWPPIPTKLAWRFGAIGLASGAMAVPVLMLLFIFALSLVLGDRKVTRTVGVISAVIGVLMLLSIGVFALDALQMKRSVAPAALTRFQTASYQAIAKMFVHGISSLVLALGAFRSSRLAAVAMSRSSKGTSQLLVSMAHETPRVSAPTTPAAPASAEPANS